MVKPRKILAKVRKDLKLKKKPLAARRAVRRTAVTVLAQGAVAPPRKNFGTAIAARKPNRSALLKCLDARIPRTLGLPRAVGPYSVIRTTVLHKSPSRFILFAPFLREIDQRSQWCSWAGVESVTASEEISAPNNTRPIVLPMGGLLDACEVVPAAMTVQVMNPASLQQAVGIFAMGRVNQQLDIGGASETWETLKQRCIAFYSPRMLTGGKLALRGVKCSTYPLDMNEYSDFNPVNDFVNDFTWDTKNRRPAALAPIVFMSDSEPAVTMEFMVTIEWRVRFDPGNPATASHAHHDTLSDTAWNDVVKTASACGHGVEELSEDAVVDGALMGAAMLMA